MAERRGNGLAWLALLVAVAALWLAWTAYRRTGGDTAWLREPLTVGGAGDAGREERREGTAGDAGERRGVAAELARAREELSGWRAEIEAKRGDWREAVDDIERVRRDLADAYAGASGEAREQWRQLDGDLDRLQDQAREGSAEAGATLERLLDRLRRGPRDEDEPGTEEPAGQ